MTDRVALNATPLDADSRSNTLDTSRNADEHTNMTPDAPVAPINVVDNSDSRSRFCFRLLRAVWQILHVAVCEAYLSSNSARGRLSLYVLSPSPAAALAQPSTKCVHQ
eukprot:CAMPEP_0181139392 /NCGR_PEP_ID=MMETSP1071-20121207/34757_1 /TAXON_ID=35127 /ORGANISM="Thalassiosira sp., Strain NH16" /LENGTH=107 /DNA_ID=CAMNT_0023226295 /DNA_START=148 /DNA_END=471 /DNA_ORIENTATION=+